jgi:hypothetical protein
MHSARLAASRTDWTAGKSIAIKMAMIAITTNNSTNVNAIRERLSKVTTGWFMIQLSEGDSRTTWHYGLKARALQNQIFGCSWLLWNHVRRYSCQV